MVLCRGDDGVDLRRGFTRFGNEILRGKLLAHATYVDRLSQEWDVSQTLVQDALGAPIYVRSGVRYESQDLSGEKPSLAPGN